MLSYNGRPARLVLPRVMIGQIWQDHDCRYRKATVPRRVEVIDVLDQHAIVRNLEGGKRTRVKLLRFKPSSSGYLLIRDPTAKTDLTPRLRKSR